ncbi:MAG: 4Fe-4S dicluster domain-containing protein [Treponema sp.]|jgi:carbon-monoxide dehydrogenase iron sulfur subunit|nr:4Fe-4S dicluster domain-containing protein [Treponema sp.]
MKRIFIDRDKCEGCKNCTLACMQAHREKLALESRTASSAGTLYDLDLLDPKTEARNEIVADGKGGYVPLFCRHCSLPECAGACMSGALKKETGTGHIQYEEKRCGTCFMCVMSCPYGNVKPDFASRSKILKCDFCKDDDLGPNCVRACPTKALYVEEVMAGV